MSKQAIARLKKELGDEILETSDFRGDDQAIVAPKHWEAVARFLRDDPELAMNQFVDITAADYPERAPEQPRFDVLLLVRSTKTGHRVRLKTRVAEDESLATLVGLWAGANWGEREIYDMFGIHFEGHPDLRRILMYPEFVGYPLRKDYPIDRAQPLIPYRDVEGIEKLPPFGPEEGQPWSRIDWPARLEGEDLQVSPAIATQVGQRPALSTGADDLAPSEGAARTPEEAGATSEE